MDNGRKDVGTWMITRMLLGWETVLCRTYSKSDFSIVSGIVYFLYLKT